MEQFNNPDNLDEILTKEEVLKLFESVAENAQSIMLAKDACKCGGGNCSCSTSGVVGCC